MKRLTNVPIDPFYSSSTVVGVLIAH